MALRQRAQQHVARLAPRRYAAAVLLQVHALVGDVERVLGAGGLRRQHHRAVGAGDREAVPVLAERLGGFREQLVDVAVLGRGEDAELVAAHPVRVATALDGLAERAAQADEEGVAGGVAEDVVVGLEAVEIEDREAGGAVRGRLGDHELELARQRAAVAEPGERVRGGLRPAGGEHPAVVAVGDHEPHQHRHETGAGERESEHVGGVEVVEDQQPSDAPAKTIGSRISRRALAASARSGDAGVQAP